MRRLRTRRRLARQRNVVVALYVSALSLLGIHSVFHVSEWLWYPPYDALTWLYGSSDVGRFVHAVTEIVVVSGLVTALWTVVVQRPARRTDEYVADAEKRVMLLLATELPIDALREAFAADRDELPDVKNSEH